MDELHSEHRKNLEKAAASEEGQISQLKAELAEAQDLISQRDTEIVELKATLEATEANLVGVTEHNESLIERVEGYKVGEAESAKEVPPEPKHKGKKGPKATDKK